MDLNINFKCFRQCVLYLKKVPTIAENYTTGVTGIHPSIVWLIIYIYFNVLDVKQLDNNMMIVAMHRSEGGKRDVVSNCIGTPDNPLYESKLTNLFYCKKKTVSCVENQKAKHDIESFLE